MITTHLAHDGKKQEIESSNEMSVDTIFIENTSIHKMFIDNMPTMNAVSLDNIDKVVFMLTRSRKCMFLTCLLTSPLTSARLD